MSGAAPHVAPPATTAASAAVVGWTPQQKCFRGLMKSLRAAYFHDRAKLFWARHRVLVEFYKYSTIEDEEAVGKLVGVGNQVADFVDKYMKTDVGRIVKHNEAMMSLPVAQAKKYREEYLLNEKQHESWCKQKIKAMLGTRPPPPYPFF